MRSGNMRLLSEGAVKPSSSYLNVYRDERESGGLTVFARQKNIKLIKLLFGNKTALTRFNNQFHYCLITSLTRIDLD